MSMETIPTPLTDKAEYEVRLGKHRRKVVRPELARELERKLAIVTNKPMTTTLLLNAFSVDERKSILTKLENNELVDILPLKGSHAHGFMVDRIAHDENTCANIELTIHFNVPF